MWHQTNFQPAEKCDPTFRKRNIRITGLGNALAGMVGVEELPILMLLFMHLLL